MLLAVWAAGFYFYWNAVQKPITASPQRTDAIVVLTGGSGRVTEGLDLLKQDKADLLFISGVGKDLIVEDLLAFWNGLPENISKDRITLGYAAQTTYGNALETAAWVKQKNIESIRLVTSAYHIDRALYEFRKQLPDIEIIAHPVAPENFDLNSPQGLYLLAREYTKLLVVSSCEQLLKKLGMR